MSVVPEPTEKTEALIQKLTADFVAEGAVARPFGLFWASWALGIFMVACLTVVSVRYLPEDLHLPVDLNRFWFWFENILWMTVAVLSAVVTYFNMIPGRRTTRLPMITYALISILFLSILLRWRPDQFADDWSGEMHWLQGPCGFFIFLMGIACSLGVFAVIKWRGAPVRLRWTSAWASLSMGAFGATCMHLVCLHESSMHLILWHFVPVALLAGASFAAGRWLLRW